MRGEDINSDKLRITMEILNFHSVFNSSSHSTCNLVSRFQQFILTNGEDSLNETFPFSFNSLVQVFHRIHSTCLCMFFSHNPSIIQVL